jgi:lipid-binding SYLF domain-containing protein
MKTQSFARIAVFVFLTLPFFAPVSQAKSAREIDASVDSALDFLKAEVPGGREMLAKAKGVLVLAPVIKGGIGIGAEYGTGALRIDGKTVDYYNTISGSIGFQLGGQAKKMYLLFMNGKALRDFRQSDGWKAGVDGSVALISVGADGSIDTTKTNEPIVALVLGQKGLMYNLTIEGSKFNKIKPD